MIQEQHNALERAGRLAKARQECFWWAEVSWWAAGTIVFTLFAAALAILHDDHGIYVITVALSVAADGLGLVAVCRRSAAQSAVERIEAEGGAQ